MTKLQSFGTKTVLDFPVKIGLIVSIFYSNLQ